MLVKTSKGIYALTRFSNIKNVVHGFSTTILGNMKPVSFNQKGRWQNNQHRFFKHLNLENPLVVTAEQIHSGRIALVSKKDKDRKVKRVDGLLTKDKNLFLMVLVADCLPIVAFDPKKGVIGIVHAGWRGTLAKISKNFIKAFRDLGSNVKDIKIGFGPAVEFCHYEIKEDVAKKFRGPGFGNTLLRSVTGKIFLDLKQANVRQLIEAGISKVNIDVSVRVCTYENKDFYSYRRDKTQRRIAAIVGMRDEK